MAIAGHTRINFFRRFREKVKTSAKRYHRKRERSINHNPYKGDKDKNIQRVQVIKKVINTGLKYEDFYDTIASWDKYGGQDYSTDFESE